MDDDQIAREIGAVPDDDQVAQEIGAEPGEMRKQAGGMTKDRPERYVRHRPKPLPPPGETPGRPIDEQHPEIPTATRLRLQNFATTTPNTLVRELNRMGFEATHGPGGAVLRKPGGRWYRLDPLAPEGGMAEFGKDILDVGTDAYRGGAQLFGAIGGGAAGLFAPPGAQIVTVPSGAIAGAATMGAVAEAQIADVAAQMGFAEPAAEEKREAMAQGALFAGAAEAIPAVGGPLARWAGRKVLGTMPGAAGRATARESALAAIPSRAERELKVSGLRAQAGEAQEAAGRRTAREFGLSMEEEARAARPKETSVAQVPEIPRPAPAPPRPVTRESFVQDLLRQFPEEDLLVTVRRRTTTGKQNAWIKAQGEKAFEAAGGGKAGEQARRAAIIEARSQVATAPGGGRAIETKRIRIQPHFKTREQIAQEGLAGEDLERAFLSQPEVVKGTGASYSFAEKNLVPYVDLDKLARGEARPRGSLSLPDVLVVERPGTGDRWVLSDMEALQVPMAAEAGVAKAFVRPPAEDPLPALRAALAREPTARRLGVEAEGLRGQLREAEEAVPWRPLRDVGEYRRRLRTSERLSDAGQPAPGHRTVMEQLESEAAMRAGSSVAGRLGLPVRAARVGLAALRGLPRALEFLATAPEYTVRAALKNAPPRVQRLLGPFVGRGAHLALQSAAGEPEVQEWVENWFGGE